MYLDNNFNYACGYWEFPLQEALAKVLSRGQVYYDIGANVGLFTLVGARLAGPTGRVVAFEPCPRFIEKLRSNIQINHLENTTVIPKAVSDRNSRVKMYWQSSMSHLSTAEGLDSAPKQKYEETSESHMVDTISLDEFDGPPPDVIKVDVEGSELAVLRGAQRLLSSRNAPTLILELHSPFLATEAGQLLRAHGYRFYSPWEKFRPLEEPIFYTVAAPPRLTFSWM
jgi:FkbM family methyltransferase